MADPVTLTLGATAIAGAASSAMDGMQASSQASAQANAAKYNAAVFQQQGIADTNTAAANEASQIRKSTGELGTQAAAAGQAIIGTGGSIQGVEKQSATNARMDALNIWYGGQLERYQVTNAASDQEYQARVDEQSANAGLISGSVGAGTALLVGGAKAYGYSTGKLTVEQVMPQISSGLSAF